MGREGKPKRTAPCYSKSRWNPIVNGRWGCDSFENSYTCVPGSSGSNTKQRGIYGYTVDCAWHASLPGWVEYARCATTLGCITETLEDSHWRRRCNITYASQKRLLKEVDGIRERLLSPILDFADTKYGDADAPVGLATQEKRRQRMPWKAYSHVLEV